MKKLMTMIAAVATAFGLYAADGDTGTSFEGATAGETLDSQKGVIKELPDFQATTLTYWANLDDTAVIKERDAAFENRPAQYDEKANVFCLSLSTGTKVIERYAKAGGATTDIKDGPLYFDSTVKMTVFDSDPEITASDAKLKIWLQENDADNPTATNLFVNGYDCGDYAAMADTWARVTARALKISSTQIGFIVYVDGEAVKTSATVAGLPETYIDDNVAMFGAKGQLFPSLVDDTEITGVGFAGMGSVDDIVFTEDAPSFVEDYEFYTIAANEHVTSFTAKGQTWTSGASDLKFLFEDADTVEVTGITYDGDFFGDTTTNLSVTAAGEYKVGNAQEKKVTVLIGGEQVPFASMADAIKAANFAGATISLLKDYDASDETIVVDNAAGETVLDLAGATLTGTVNYKSALKVMDSSSGHTGKIVPVGGASTENPAVAIVGEEWTEANEPTLTLESGIFDGTISIFMKSAVVTGGKFYDVLGELFPPKGANEWQEGDNTYKATWDEATSYWTVEQVTMYTVSITPGPGTTLTVKAGDEVVTNGTPVEAGTVLTISVAAAADYKDAKITVNGADYTEDTYTVEDANVAIVSSATAKEYFTDIELDKTELTLDPNDDPVQLNATTTPTTPADDTLEWTSDKPEVATVVDGVVTAVAEGTAIITVASANKPEVKETCTVTVKSAGQKWPDDPSKEQGKDAKETFPNLPATFAGADAGRVAAWAKDPNKGNLAYDKMDEADIDAFLLDCSAADVETEMAKFKIVSITSDGAGGWTIKVVNEMTGEGTTYGNGKIQLLGKTAIDAKEEWHPKTDTDTVFQAKLAPYVVGK